MPEHIVLGASGALGGAILKALISQGRPVTAVVRGRKGRVPLTGEGFRLLEADLRDVQSIAPVISPGAVRPLLLR
ncbi:MAG: NmrA family NAD(P)-binding protein [Clostridiales bacterium]|nr:NmrA family NAD(P)-binding protein [Clostridiales bacterium]